MLGQDSRSTDTTVVSRVASGAGGPYREYEASGDVVLASEVGAIGLARPSINPALPFILLGRRDFFDGRRVCFDQRRARMEVGAA